MNLLPLIETAVPAEIFLAEGNSQSLNNIVSRSTKQSCSGLENSLLLADRLTFLCSRKHDGDLPFAVAVLVIMPYCIGHLKPDAVSVC